jgi:hypothetical protein
VGSVLEERYERLDDGSLPDHARLKKLWKLDWSREDEISTVLPYEGAFTALATRPKNRPSLCTFTVPG